MRSGNLAGALAEVPDLPRPLAMHHALGLVVLFGEAGDPRFPRASARWLGRFSLERASVDLEAMHAATDALLAIDGDARHARRVLADVAAAHGLAAPALIAPRSPRP